MELNFGIKGFALFLWSHQRNDIETSSVETVEIWWCRQGANAVAVGEHVSKM